MKTANVDVLIIGGGPAGSSTAINLLKHDPKLRVAIIDKAAFPRDKICGDGIGPPGIKEIALIDSLETIADYPYQTSVRLSGPGGISTTKEVTSPGVVIPRKIFDARLVQQSQELGAKLVQQRLDSIRFLDDSVVVNESWNAKWVVAADGANSYTRRLLNIPFAKGEHMVIATRTYAKCEDTQPLEINWEDKHWPAYSWIFPLGDGTANVGFGCQQATLPTDISAREALTTALFESLPHIEIDEKALRMHHLPVTTGRPVPYFKRVLLTGDAANLINPLSGEGIYYALASGRLAANSIAGSLNSEHDAGSNYAKAISSEFGSHFRSTAFMAKAQKHKTAIKAGLISARDADTFDDLMDICLGTGTMKFSTSLAVMRCLPRALRHVA